jgi:hypothetical protein
LGFTTFICAFDGTLFARRAFCARLTFLRAAAESVRLGVEPSTIYYKDIQQRSFSEISSHLEVEAAKIKNESLEIFGLKFPVETASRWGIVLILGIQLYFWVHLYELSPKLKEGDPGWNVAWIGVYQSLPATILFLCSTALLPTLTIVTLGNHALKDAGRVVWGVYVVAGWAALLCPL